MSVLRSLRAAIALFTRLPVGGSDAQPGSILLTAPAVGVIVALLAAAPAAVLLLADAPGIPWIAATTGLGCTAYLTRGLHLDGLADFTDGLGCRSAQPVAVMQRSDIGAFGVVALILVLLLQVGLLGSLAASAGWRGLVGGLLIALAAGRSAVIWPCRLGVPAAAGSRLGAWVAGSVRPWAAAATTSLVAAAAWLLEAWAGTAAILAAIGCGFLVERSARRRFGGITGDVLGACVEVGQTAALLLLVVGRP